MKSSLLNRVIGLSVLICFLTTNAPAMPAETTMDGVRAHEVFFKIPATMGSIVETYTAPKEEYGVQSTAQKERGTRDTLHRTVIYIQDAHDSLEAQENIAGMIRHFVKEYGVREVYEEGYEGPVPTDKLFDKIQDPILKEKISYYLMDKLRVGGAEYAHINRKSRLDHRPQTTDHRPQPDKISESWTIDHGHDFDLIGADSIKLHLENVRAYEESSKTQSFVTQDIQRIRKTLQKLIDKNFPKEIKAWIKLKERFDRGELPLVEYLQRTRNAQSALNAQRATHNEKVLTLNVTRSPLRKNAFEQIDLLFSKDEKNLGKVDLGTLFKEIKELETEIIENGLPAERDQKTYGYFRSILLLEKLNALSLSAEEFASLKDSLETVKTEDIAHFIAKETGHSVLLFRSWENLISSSIEFYELAQKRDDTLKKILGDGVEGIGYRKNQVSEGLFAKPYPLNPNISILVFGGFHKEAIKKMLKEKGISYVILSPVIGAPSKRHEDYYRMLMGGGKYSFEKEDRDSGFVARDTKDEKKFGSETVQPRDRNESRVPSPEARAKGVARESTRPQTRARFASPIKLNGEATCPQRAVTMNYVPVIDALEPLAKPFRGETRQNFILKMDQTFLRSESRSLEKNGISARPNRAVAEDTDFALLGSDQDGIYETYPALWTLSLAWDEFLDRQPERATQFRAAKQGGFFGQSPFYWIPAIKKRYSLNPRSRILDVGSGNGLMAFAFHIVTGAQVISIEMDEDRQAVLNDFLKFLKTEKHIEYPAVQFQKADFLDYSLRNFNLIYFYYTQPPQYGESFSYRVVRHLENSLPVNTVFVSPAFYLPGESMGVHENEREAFFGVHSLHYQKFPLRENAIIAIEAVELSRRAETREPVGNDFLNVRKFDLKNFITRSENIFWAVIGLAVFYSLLFPFAALAIRWTSKRPIFFKQERVGYQGRKIVVTKLSSFENPDKVTPIGRFLRKWGIDEMPQLWLVLSGAMSIIGPRPKLQSELAASGEGSTEKMPVPGFINTFSALFGSNEGVGLSKDPIVINAQRELDIYDDRNPRRYSILKLLILSYHAVIFRAAVSWRAGALGLDLNEFPSVQKYLETRVPKVKQRDLYPKGEPSKGLGSHAKAEEPVDPSNFSGEENSFFSPQPRSEMRAESELGWAEYDLEKEVPEKYWDLPIVIDLIADNTGTLSVLHNDPPPETLQRKLKKFLRGNNRLIVATGDDAQMALESQASIIDSLVKRKTTHRWLITSAGGTMIGWLTPEGRFNSMVIANPWPLEVGVRLAKTMVRAFYGQVLDQIKRREAGVEGLTPQVVEGHLRQALESIEKRRENLDVIPAGATQNILHYVLEDFGYFGKTAFVYASGLTKIAVQTATASRRYGWLNLDFFEGMAQAVKAVLTDLNEMVQFIPSFNFLDVTSGTKKDGILAILKKIPRKSKDGSRKLYFKVGIGDGLNDLVFLNHNFANANQPEIGLSVVLNYDPVFASRLEPHVFIANRPYVMGAEEILDWLNQISGKTVRQLIDEGKAKIILRKWQRSEMRENRLTENNHGNIRRESRSVIDIDRSETRDASQAGTAKSSAFGGGDVKQNARQLAAGNAAAGVEDLNAEHPAVPGDVDHNTFRHFARVFGFSRLKLDVQGIRFLIERNFHRLLSLFNPVGCYQDYLRFLASVNDYKNLITEAFIRQTPSSITCFGLIGTGHSLFELFLDQFSLANPWMSLEQMWGGYRGKNLAQHFNRSEMRSQENIHFEEVAEAEAKRLAAVFDRGLSQNSRYLSSSLSRKEHTVSATAYFKKVTLYRDDQAILRTGQADEEKILSNGFQGKLVFFYKLANQFLDGYFMFLTPEGKMAGYGVWAGKNENGILGFRFCIFDAFRKKGYGTTFLKLIIFALQKEKPTNVPVSQLIFPAAMSMDPLASGAIAPELPGFLLERGFESVGMDGGTSYVLDLRKGRSEMRDTSENKRRFAFVAGKNDPPLVVPGTVSELEEARDRLIEASAILSHGGPLDYGTQIQALMDHLTSANRHSPIGETYQIFEDSIRPLARQANSIMNGIMRLEEENSVDAGTIQKLTEDYRKWLQDYENGLQKLVDDLPSKFDQNNFPDSISEALSLSARWILNFKAISAMLDGPRAEEIVEIDLGAWLSRRKWETKQQGYEVVPPARERGSFFVKISAELLHLTIERILSNGFHAIPRTGQADEEKILMELSKGTDGASQPVVRIAVWSPGTIDKSKLEWDSARNCQRLFILDHNRENYYHGIAMPFAFQACLRLGGRIFIENAVRSGSGRPYVKTTVELPYTRFKAYSGETWKRGKAVGRQEPEDPQPSSFVSGVLSAQENMKQRRDTLVARAGSLIKAACEFLKMPEEERALSLKKSGLRDPKSPLYGFFEQVHSNASKNTFFTTYIENVCRRVFEMLELSPKQRMAVLLNEWGRIFAGFMPSGSPGFYEPRDYAERYRSGADAPSLRALEEEMRNVISQESDSREAFLSFLIDELNTRSHMDVSAVALSSIIATFGDNAVEPLKALLKKRGNNPNVRIRVALTLHEIGLSPQSKNAEPALQEMAKSEKNKYVKDLIRRMLSVSEGDRAPEVTVRSEMRNGPLISSDMTFAARRKLVPSEARSEVKHRSEAREPFKNLNPSGRMIRTQLENLKGQFKIMTSIADVAAFSEEQLQEFEAMAYFLPNVSFVFYGRDQDILSDDKRKRLEQWQRDLGAERIFITNEPFENLRVSGPYKYIHISKGQRPTLLDSRIYQFHYMAEETGLVAMALLYADQHAKPAKFMMNLSMVTDILRVALLDFQNSIVFAHAA